MKLSATMYARNVRSEADDKGECLSQHVTLQTMPTEYVQDKTAIGGTMEITLAKEDWDTVKAGDKVTVTLTGPNVNLPGPVGIK